MTIDRRGFISSAAALAATGAIAPRATRAQGRATPPGSDPLGVRGDFPILNNGRTFLNSAYITPSPAQVIEAGAAFIRAKSERAITVGEMLTKAGEVRAQFARLVNASPDEIGFVFATSEGENTVANNVPMAPGDNVVVDDLHYDGALVAHRELERRRGIELRIVKNRDGIIAPADFVRVVDGRTKLIAVSLVSSINGLRHDARALADLAHAHGALLHLDAIQGLGTFPFDVRATDVDFICSGTYKGLLAGFGVAPFYIKRSLLDRVGVDRFGIFQVANATADHHFTLRADARRYDYATLPFAEVHQLGAGIAYLEKVGVARIAAHIQSLTLRLGDGLVRQGFRLFTPAGNRSAIVAFHYMRPMAEVRAVLDAAKIDLTLREGHARASVGLFNNSEEIDRLLAVTKTLA